MRTTKKDFEQFKKEFLRWVEIFGLKDYTVTFAHRNLDNDIARIGTNEQNKTASVGFNTYIKNYPENGYFGPEQHAKHEAIHLLLSKLSYIATCRYCDYSEIESAEEGIVRILEKVLK